MKARNNNQDLWDERAVRGNTHKGQELYTISPLPFYLKRRGIMLGLAKPEVLQANTIMDFGCGDGWYLHHFNGLARKKQELKGLDISPEMVKKAKQLNPDLEIYVSEKGIKPQEKYDLIYTFATLAHIEENMIRDTFQNIVKSLHDKGGVMLFEQVAPSAYSGNGYIRRTIEDYIRLGEEAGLKIKKLYLLSFDSHRFFERHIAKKYIRFCKGRLDYEKRLRANSHKSYRALSKFFLFFDRKPVRENARSGWGNVLIIFERKQ